MQQTAIYIKSASSGRGHGLTPNCSFSDSMSAQSSGDKASDGFPYMKRDGSTLGARNLDRSTPLINAIINGDTEEANKEITQGANVNHANAIGETPLMKASKNGHTALVKLLLKKGADPDFDDIGGGTALMRAAYEGSMDIGKLLIGAKTDVNARDRKGWTALCIATSNGHLEFARMLIDNGAVFKPMKTYEDFGAYWISSVSFNNCVDIESAMERIFNVFVNSCVTRMVEWKVICSDLSFNGSHQSGVLISQPFFPSDYSDMEAVPYAKAEQMLVKFGEIKFSCSLRLGDAKLKHEEKYGLSGKFTRTKEGFSVSAKIDPNIGIRWHIANLLNTAFISSVAYGNVESAKSLIDMGADVNWKDKAGQSALMWAAFMGHPKMAELLIQKGADLNFAYEGLNGKRSFPDAIRTLSGLSTPKK